MLLSQKTSARMELIAAQPTRDRKLPDSVQRGEEAFDTARVAGFFAGGGGVDQSQRLPHQPLQTLRRRSIRRLQFAIEFLSDGGRGESLSKVGTLGKHGAARKQG